MHGHVLILGGTAQARRLAAELTAPAGSEEPPRLRVTSSLAGRVARPRMPAGEVRIGGFGGAEGLARWMAAERVTALVDATHPFAATITAHAARAAESVGVPWRVLRGPGWPAEPGDRRYEVDTPAEAAALLPSLGRRVFLTVGRQGLAPFAVPNPAADLWFLVRAVERPEPPLPAAAEVLLDRGPYDLTGELALLREHRIDVLVTKDSGTPATAAKLTAARELDLPVVVIRRPALPPGAVPVRDVAAALEWLVGLE